MKYLAAYALLVLSGKSEPCKSATSLLLLMLVEAEQP